MLLSRAPDSAADRGNKGRDRAETLRLDKKRIGDAALITGASSGLGRELAIAFSETGHVIIHGRNVEGLEATRSACKDPKNTTILDGTLNSSAVRVRLASFADLYSIKYLICCAGEYQSGKFESVAADKIRSVLDTNLTDTISLVRATYPTLIRTSGTVIAINSVAGRAFNSEESVYVASKFGLTGFMESFRYEARQRNVRVLDVFAGGIQTPMSAGHDGYESLMDAKEVADVIYKTATTAYQTVAVEQLQLGKFRLQ